MYTSQSSRATRANPDAGCVLCMLSSPSQVTLCMHAVWHVTVHEPQCVVAVLQTARNVLVCSSQEAKFGMVAKLADLG